MFSGTKQGIRLEGDYADNEIPAPYKKELVLIVNSWYSFLQRVGARADVVYKCECSALNFYPHDVSQRKKITETYTFALYSEPELVSLSSRLDFILQQLADIRKMVPMLRFWFKNNWKDMLFPEHPMSTKNPNYLEDRAKVLQVSNNLFIQSVEDNFYSFIATKMLVDI